MFVLLSENPNFADKIQRFICLSAVMFQSDNRDESEVLVAPLRNIFNQM